MTIPEQRLQELRALALASGPEPVSDPAELTRMGIRAHLARTGRLLPPDRPELDLRLFGAGIQNDQATVRDAAAILLSVQETVASIGQALTHEPTLQGVIQAQILTATELRLTPDIGAGSVVFRLLGPGESVSGNEVRELTGTDTLVDAAMSRLFTLVEQSAVQGPDSSDLAQALRRLGPRTAKHLSDLVRRVIADEIDIDLSWRSPAGQRRRASLHRPAAQALTRAIELNRVETQTVELIGILDTISTTHKIELRTDDARVHLAADKILAATLGPFYNQMVIAIVERTTTWSTNTGKEKKTFRLLGVRPAEAEAEGSTLHSGERLIRRATASMPPDDQEQANVTRSPDASAPG